MGTLINFVIVFGPLTGLVLLWRRARRSARYERRLEHSTIERLTGHGAAWDLFDGRRWPDDTRSHL